MREEIKNELPESVTCPYCNKTSYNLADIEYNYCVKCGFHGHVEELRQKEATKEVAKNMTFRLTKRGIL